MSFDPDNRYAPYTSATEAVLTVEMDGGCDTEEEYIAYLRALVDTGLVNSTGSFQRAVADGILAYGVEAILGEAVQ